MENSHRLPPWAALSDSLSPIFRSLSFSSHYSLIHDSRHHKFVKDLNNAPLAERLRLDACDLLGEYLFASFLPRRHRQHFYRPSTFKISFNFLFSIWL